MATLVWPGQDTDWRRKLALPELSAPPQLDPEIELPPPVGDMPGMEPIAPGPLSPAVPEPIPNASPNDTPVWEPIKAAPTSSDITLGRDRTLFDPAVEKWRPLIEKYFPPDQVNKALYVVQHESGGNASIMNNDAAVNGPSPGLFQITAANARAAGIDGIDPEQATRWAAQQVAAHGWTDWGEGTNYKGTNFGALGGANPYGPGGTGLNDIGRITGGLIGSAVRSLPADSSDTGYTVRPSISDAYDVDQQAPAGSLRSRLLEERNGGSAYGGLPSRIAGVAGAVVKPLIGGLDLSTGSGTQTLVQPTIPRPVIGSSTPDIDQQAPGTLRQKAIDEGAYDNRTFPIASRLQKGAGDIGAAIGGVLPDFELPRNAYGKPISMQNEEGTITPGKPTITISPKGIGRDFFKSFVPDTETQFATYPVTLATNLQAAEGVTHLPQLLAGAGKSLLETGGGSILRDASQEGAGAFARGATHETPLSDVELAMQASLDAGKQGALDKGASKAADFVAQARAGQAAEGAQYAEATDLSKRVAALTGLDPSEVRQAAISRTKQTLDALKMGIRNAGNEEGLLDNGLHAGLDGKLGKSPLEQAAAARRPTTSPTGMPLYAPDSMADLDKIAAVDREQKGLGGSSFYKPTAPKPVGPLGKVVNEALGIVGLPQTLMSSGDISGAGRQMLPGLFVDKDAYVKGLKALAGGYSSEEATLAGRAAVEQSPWYNILKEAGVHEYDWGAGVAAGERVPGRGGINDSFVGKLLESKWRIRGQQVPNPFAASERAMAAGLNTEGFAAAESYIQKIYDTMMADPKGFDAAAFKRQLKAVAQVTNHMRGYGADIFKIAPGFNALFSGRNTASRFQLIADMLTQPGSLWEPSARQMAAKSLVGLAAANAALLSFAGVTGAMAGGLWSAEVNPFSGDFGKVRVGNTRFDATAGFGPLLRLLVRDGAAATDYGSKELEKATGAHLSTDLAPNNFDWKKSWVQFFENKESPLVQVIAEAISGKDSIGNKVTWGPERLADMAMLFTQDIRDAWKENASLPLPARAAVAGVTGVASATGFGASSYHTMTDYRDELATKLQPNADGKYPTKTGARPSSFADINDYGVRKQIDEQVKGEGHAYAPSKAQIAGDSAKAEIDQRVQQMTDAHKNGQLNESIGDRLKRVGGERLGRGETLSAFYDQEGISPTSAFAKKFAGLMGDSDKGTGYAGLASQFADEYGQLDYGKLKQAQADYVAKLAPEDQQLFKSYLAYQDSQRSPIEKERDKYYADKEAAGYYADVPGESLADRKKRLMALGKQLDNQHPDLDVEGWFLGGGTKDPTTTPTLSTPHAIEMALKREQDDGLKGFPIKMQGLPRPINQDENSRKAWEAGQEPLTWYLDDGSDPASLVGANWKAEAKRLAGLPSSSAADKAEFAKPLTAMDPDHRGRITGNLRETAKKSSAELEAWLYWWGADDKISTQKAANELGTIMQKYGSTSPK